MSNTPFTSDESIKFSTEFFDRKEIVSPFFGQLSYTMSGHYPFCWQGSICFVPIQKNINLFIRLSKDDLPTEEEWKFYKAIEDNYQKLSERIAKEDLAVYLKSQQSRLSRKHIWNVFELTAIVIMKNVVSERQWNLEFSSSLDSKYYSILMLDWHKRGLWVNNNRETFDV